MGGELNKIKANRPHGGRGRIGITAILTVYLAKFKSDNRVLTCHTLLVVLFFDKKSPQMLLGKASSTTLIQLDWIDANHSSRPHFYHWRKNTMT